MGRSGKGRQKIEMRKISKGSNLQVSFSKRRFGLFEKASELCTLCGVMILLIVFSPGGKVFSFGHPNVKDLFYHFENHYHNPLFYHRGNNNLQLIRTQPDEHIQLLNDKLTEEMAKQEVEKDKRKFLKFIREIREKKENWWKKDVRELDMNQTNLLICAVENMKKKLQPEMSQYPQNYIGESSRNNITSGNINNVGVDLFDQRRMLDLNAFNCNSNMIVPEYRPVFDYCNNRGFVPEYNMNYVSRNNFSQSYRI